ncbi:MAG: ribonuclease HII [Daejeonella sp.]|uniref:ribonuclease HII n=1 Tax=Daejeonella sp. TaxID=2805397 RepID=UPI0027377157|nr:ribonuclease HII [Daejeonella sp.]MDP3469530.1 ribonuclease HII [Daejeonella sp.]
MLLPYFQQGLIEAGCDEAGRGCLAGPVFAAAVILPESFSHPLLNDSKKINENDRFELRNMVEREALAFAVASVDHSEIDKINILNASIKAMHLALGQLSIRPGFIIIDGNRFKPFQDVTHQCIIKGDSKYYSIAAASILAKTYRDEYMLNLGAEYPQYDWKRNKGYPTIQHRNAVIANGLSPFHRKTFRISDPQLSLAL